MGISTRQLGPLHVAVVGKNDVISRLKTRFSAGDKTDIAFANTNLVTQAYRRPTVARDLKGFLILNDGIGLTIASKIFHGQGFIDNLNGTDFTPELLKALPQGTRVFLYGSKAHVLERASKVLEEGWGVTVVGQQDGYTKVDMAELCAHMNKVKAEVVLVALGNPRQEEWIAANRARINAPICIGVGAFLDFTAGEFKRAPLWIQKLKMEWFYRLMNEPKRLARRYTLDILVFLWVCRKFSKGAAASALSLLLMLGLSGGAAGCAANLGTETKHEPVVYEVSGTSNGMIGVNLAGGEFNGGRPNAVLNRDYVYPTAKDMAYFANKKFALVRVPFSWERVQPKLNKSLDGREVGYIRRVLDEAQAQNLKVILDVHNYAAYKKQRIGTEALPITAHTDLWRRLAKEFKDHPALWAYGMMNEPVGIAKGVWPKAAQDAIYAIRAEDKRTLILVPGESWSSAERWVKANPEFPLKDPSNNLRYEAHVYFDKDASGTYKKSFAEDGASVERVEKRFKPFIDWLAEHKVKGFIGEFGVPATPEWQPLLQRGLEIMHENDIPSTYWAAGAWWGNYPLSVQPSKDGGDRPQMRLLQKFAVKPLP